MCSPPRAQEGAGKIDLAASAGEYDADLVARQCRAGREVEAAIVGVGVEIDEPIAKMRPAARFQRALYVRYGSTLADDDLRRRIDLDVLCRMRQRHERFDDRRLGALADANDVARGDEVRLASGAARKRLATALSSLAPAAMSTTAPSDAYAVLRASTASSSRLWTRNRSAAPLSLASAVASEATVTAPSATSAERSGT